MSETEMAVVGTITGIAIGICFDRIRKQLMKGDQK
jgi:uncharacterized membrane-anchored protein YhcB (DUF1043 family)